MHFKSHVAAHRNLESYQVETSVSFTTIGFVRLTQTNDWQQVFVSYREIEFGMGIALNTVTERNSKGRKDNEQDYDETGFWNGSRIRNGRCPGDRFSVF